MKKLLLLSMVLVVASSMQALSFARPRAQQSGESDADYQAYWSEYTKQFTNAAASSRFGSSKLPLK